MVPCSHKKAPYFFICYFVWFIFRYESTCLKLYMLGILLTRSNAVNLKLKKKVIHNTGLLHKCKHIWQKIVKLFKWASNSNNMNFWPRRCFFLGGALVEWNRVWDRPFFCMFKTTFLIKYGIEVVEKTRYHPYIIASVKSPYQYNDCLMQGAENGCAGLQ